MTTWWRYGTKRAELEARGCGTFDTKNVGTSDGAAFAAVGATKRGVGNSVVPLRIEDLDFVANFTDGHWTVSWKWTKE